MEIVDFIGKSAKYDEFGQFIWGFSETSGYHKLADVRGYGTIQNMFIRKDGTIDSKEAGIFQDKLGEWIVEAINEKLDRERNIVK